MMLKLSRVSEKYMNTKQQLLNTFKEFAEELGDFNDSPEDMVKRAIGVLGVDSKTFLAALPRKTSGETEVPNEYDLSTFF